MDLQEFLRRGLLDAVVDSVSSRHQANIILDSIGFPKSSRSRFNSDNSVAYWQGICQNIDSGILEAGTDLQILVDALARRFPTNPAFQAPSGIGSSTSRVSTVSPQTEDSPASDYGAVAAQVFISYSSADREKVHEVKAELTRRGVPAWIDTREITNQKSFVSQLEESLAKARIVIVFLGPGPPGRWQKLEIDYAITRHADGDLVIIPVLINDVGLDGLSPFLRTLNAFDLSASDGFERLVEEIQRHVS